MLKSHVLIYELVDWLRKEQVKTERNLLKIRTGIVYARKPKYITLDERIKAIVSKYSKENFEDFFDNLSLILHYKSF